MYWLELLSSMRIYLVFHVSKLHKYQDLIFITHHILAPPPPPPIFMSSEKEYEVEKILDQKIRRNQQQFLVKYKATWEPETHLANMCLAIWASELDHNSHTLTAINGNTMLALEEPVPDSRRGSSEMELHQNGKSGTSLLVV